MSTWRDLSVWERLEAEGGGVSGVIAAAAGIDPGEAAAIARLRKHFDIDLVAAAIELAQARRKAARKFARAHELWCDCEGVEQASSDAVAWWKAQRIKDVVASDAVLLDVCCGIGGDTAGFARAGVRVEGIDLEPRRAWMAARNANCSTRVTAAEAIDLCGSLLHADPARRDERGKRSWNLADHQPSAAWMKSALSCARACAIKFSPGVDRHAFGDMALEWEFIEEGSTLVQAIAWGGEFARAAGQTRATMLPAGVPSAGQSETARVATHSLVGVADEVRADRLPVQHALDGGEFLSEPAAAVERAQLLTVAAHASQAGGGDPAYEIARGLGLLVSRAPFAGPWFESFEIIEEVAANASAITAALARHALAPRSVRVRGGVLDADALTRALGCRPSGNAVIFAWRDGKQPRACVTRVRAD